MKKGTTYPPLTVCVKGDISLKSHVFRLTLSVYNAPKPYICFGFPQQTGFWNKAGNCSVETQLKFFHFQVSISFYIFASRGGLAHRHSLLEFPQQPQWMTARHWRGLFLWADTADLNFKTWCKTVIKSQLQLVSMKSQLSVSGAVNEVFLPGRW